MEEVQKDNNFPIDDFKARPYQDQLLEIALKENVIIYLPTGAGKTYIALMAMRHMSGAIQGSIKDGAKRSIFICNTVALAKQQADVIRRTTNLKVSVYTGDLNVDNWKNDKWNMEFDVNQVIVATVQIIVDVIRHGYMKITQFNLIIFDECHHAKGDHPMFQLMSFFQKHNESELPRVIGLTGLLISPSSKLKIVDELNSLESTFRSKIITVESFDEFRNVLIYSTKPKEIILTYESHYVPLRLCDTIKTKINICLDTLSVFKIDQTHVKLSKNLQTQRAPNPIKRIENLLKDFLYQMEDLGMYASSLAILAVVVELEIRKRSCETILFRKILRAIIYHCEEINNLIHTTINDDDDEGNPEDILYQKILAYSTPKLIAFLKYLKQSFYGKNSNDIKALVFVQRRHTAKCLYHVIKNFVSSLPGLPIKAEFMVGQNESIPESIEYILEAKWNRNVLTFFKKNECNLIVCSSVLEEGIDIQSCNNVIMFDQFCTFRSYIQTKGRARKEDSTYTVLVSNADQPKIITKVRDYKEIDATLKQYLIGKTIDRLPPLQEEVDKQFQLNIEPFFTHTGARLDATSAIQLLARYCMVLPTDSFTTLTIDWDKKVKDGYIYVRLLLPLQSAIKDEIWSVPTKSVKVGKQSAAFNACKKLFEFGELNDNLLPITKAKRAELVSPMYFSHWKNFASDNPKTAGTKHNKRLYDIEFPSQLKSALAKENTENYMYTIHLTPLFEPDSENKHLIKLFSTTNCFAILTSKPLPRIAEMPMFMNYGEVNVKIAENPIKTYIKSEEIEYLRKFHVLLFRDILNIWNEFLSYDRNNEENSFLIVPVLNGKEIDWDLVKKDIFSNVQPVNELHRSSLKFNAEDYEETLICPWYSADFNIKYVVLKVREDLTPFSPFPNTDFESFADYAFNKYQVRVMNSKSFLLLAKPITTRQNFLVYHNEGVTKKKRKLDDILLIPELCHNFKFPGNMYLKAKFLPSILHRLHYILHAENLRQDINSFLKLNFPTYTPKSLFVDVNLKRIKDEQNKSTKPICNSYRFSNSSQTHTECIKNLKSMTEIAHIRWKEYEEPCDFSRELQKLYGIEIDYYYEFVTNRLEKITLNDNEEILSATNQVKSDRKTKVSERAAICDTPSNEKIHIKILDIMNDPKQSAEQWEFLTAITAASANDVFDMERVELLGDSFLKFSISLYLLYKHPQWNEGHLTSVKGKFVSNRNLLYCATKLKLPGRLNLNKFSPREDWIPPLVNVPSNLLHFIKLGQIPPKVLWNLKLSQNEITSGKCESQTIVQLKPNERVIVDNDVDNSLNVFIKKQAVTDKTCADSMEAILGICVKNYGIQKSFSMLEYLGIIREGEKLSTLLNLDLGSPRLKANIKNHEIDAFLINYHLLEQTLGYKFNERAYLLQALTHPSYPKNRLTGCYQQLEFIGDAILDFLISCYIFERCTHMDPGKLTDLRSALVNNVTLACIAVRNKFHLYILSQNAGLSQSIEKFVAFQEKQNNIVTDQVRILIQEGENFIESEVSSKEANNKLKLNLKTTMADYIDVPKTLGDIFEAIIGAIFLDSKNNLQITWKCIYHLLENELNEFMRNVPKQIVRQLYEYHGANPVFSSPVDDDDDITLITCKFTCHDKICEVTGFGKNKQQAKIAAAKLALQTLIQQT